MSGAAQKPFLRLLLLLSSSLLLGGGCESWRIGVVEEGQGGSLNGGGRLAGPIGGGVTPPRRNDRPEISGRPGYVYHPRLPWNRMLTSLGALPVATRPEIDSRPLPASRLSARRSGVLTKYEHSPWFQSVSRWCIEGNDEPFSTKSHFCNVAIDGGISLVIEAIGFDSAILCYGMVRLTDSPWPCLAWALMRHYFPTSDLLLPQGLHSEYNYMRQRKLI